MSNRHLLIVYHTQSGNTGRLAEAGWRDATDEEVAAVDVRRVKAADAGPEDLLWSDALPLGTVPLRHRGPRRRRDSTTRSPGGARAVPS